MSGFFTVIQGQQWDALLMPCEQNEFSEGTKHPSTIFLAHFLAIVLVGPVTSDLR